MIQIGNDKIKDIYVGSDKIKEVYYGSEKVWGKQPAVQDGYWVHKDTNAVTYFGADADFITGGIMNEPSWKLDCSEVKLPSGVTGLGLNCFYGCESLTSINIPESVTSLGVNCFRDCTSLSSITLPESVTSIGFSCFLGCSALILITVLPATPPSLGGSAFATTHVNLAIKVPAQSVDDYKTATNWISYSSKISAI